MSSKNLIKENTNVLPEYDGSESLTKYLSRMKDLRFKLNSHKYDKILEFLNIWLKKYNINLKSLTDFKKVPEKLLLSDESYNKKILDKHYTSLSNDLDINNENYDSDNLSTEEYEKLEKDYKLRNNILSFIKEILTTIDYGLIINKIKKMNSKNIPIIETVYSIKINKQ
jgi:hypothetical protein